MKGNQYWEFYDAKMRVQKGYPKNFGDHWLGCKGGNLMKSVDDESVVIRNRLPHKKEVEDGTVNTEKQRGDNMDDAYAHSSHTVSSTLSLAAMVSLVVLLTH